MTAPLYVPTGAPVQGSKGQSSKIRTEFTAIETAIDLLNEIPLFAYAADLNTADSFWIPTPGWAGTVLELYAVAYDANSVAATGLTLEIGGSAATLSATWEFGAAAAAGDQVTVDVSSGGDFTAGQPLEIVSDGLGTGTLRAMLCALIARTS